MTEWFSSDGKITPSLSFSVLFLQCGCSVWDYISWTFLNETLPQEIRGVAGRLSMSVVLICYALAAHFGLPLLAYLEFRIFDIMCPLVTFSMLIFYALLPDNDWSWSSLSILGIGPAVYFWENHFLWKGYFTLGYSSAA